MVAHPSKLTRHIQIVLITCLKVTLAQWAGTQSSNQHLSASTTVTVTGWSMKLQQLLCVETYKSELRHPLYRVVSTSQLIWPSFTWEDPLGSTVSLCACDQCLCPLRGSFCVCGTHSGPDQLGSHTVKVCVSLDKCNRRKLVEVHQFESEKMNSAQ